MANGLKLKNKVAAELSLSVIIVAILVLLVLVVISFILLKGAGNFQTGVSSCDGVCVLNTKSCENDFPKNGFVAIPSACPNPQDGATDDVGKYCCQTAPGFK